MRQVDSFRGMRNIYAHNYERAEPGILWQTITEDIPMLRGKIQDALDKCEV